MINVLVYLFVMGLLFGSGPCMASCGPLMVSYVLGARKAVSGSLVFYFLFSLARIISYLVLGLLLFFLGRVVLSDYMSQISRYVYIAAGIFVILVGILLIAKGRVDFWPCRFLEHYFVEKDSKTILAFGFFVGLLPCAPLVALFSYVALVSKTWLQTMFYCLSFGLGTFFSPLILFVLLAGLFPNILKNKQNRFTKAVQIVGGAGVIILGFVLLKKGV